MYSTTEMLRISLEINPLFNNCFLRARVHTLVSSYSILVLLHSIWTVGKYIVAHLIGIGKTWASQLDICWFICGYPMCSIRVCDFSFMTSMHVNYSTSLYIV